MKNPNGWGSVAKLSGKRRNPYVVRKTVGWNAKGHPQYEVVGYCATREDGMMLLAEYNKQPWDLKNAKITFQELFDLWTKKKLPNFGQSNAASMRGAFKHCTALYSLEFRAIRSYHMQECIDTCGRGYSTQGAIKALLRHLDEFALELDVVNKCYSSLIKSAPIPETTKKPFTEDEISRLWDLKECPWVDSVLVFLYTGFRISELLSVRCEDVDLQQRTIKGGTKTQAGKNRIVPIHPRILPLIQNQMSGEYLFEHKGRHCSNSQYYIYWAEVMKLLRAEHTTHECRHTFRSLLDAAGANKVCIDLMMGHKSKEVGERVYTHKTIEQLHEAITKLC